MIAVTRLKGSTIMINSELIEVIEETPDTVITLTNGKKFIVTESMQYIRQLVVEYKRELFYHNLNFDKE